MQEVVLQYLRWGLRLNLPLRSLNQYSPLAAPVKETKTHALVSGKAKKTEKRHLQIELRSAQKLLPIAVAFPSR